VKVCGLPRRKNFFTMVLKDLGWKKWKKKGGYFNHQCVDERKIIKMCTWLGFVPQSSAQKRLHRVHKPHPSVQYHSHNKQRLLPQAALTSWS